MSIALKAIDIGKVFKNPMKVKLFSGIDLEVQKGESVAITGKSGQGKSTLLHILGTLEPASSGDLEIDGEPVTFWNRSRIRNKKAAFIFQSFHLMEEMTALENVQLPSRIGGSKLSAHSALALLEKVGLSERAHFLAKLLSGGEKQRVAIARAFAQNPEIILADEPSGNLDEESAAQIHQYLLDFVKKERKACIIVTHDKSLAALCDRTLELSCGSLEIPRKVR